MNRTEYYSIYPDVDNLCYIQFEKSMAMCGN